MDAAQPKKMLIINILEILRKHSDDNHRISQKEIQDILEREYEMPVDRKAVKRNLMSLVEGGYPIEYSETARRNKAGEEDALLTDWYYVHEFTNPELRLLVDSLLFYRHVPNNHRKDLIKKLEGLSSEYFSARVKHIRAVQDTRPESPELFFTIEVLDEAISKKRMVSFQYNEYGVDKHPYPRTNLDGSVRVYKVSPYQMAAINGRYYLICNRKYHDLVSHYRIDRISGIEILDEPVRPMKEVTGLENGLNLPRHMAEHLYMFTGESSRVRFRAKREIINDILDWFDYKVLLCSDGDNHVIADVYVNLLAMQYWAMQYGESVEVLSPEVLREAVKASVNEMGEKYG